MRGAPKLRIGSQRPGSPKVKARPQVAHAEPPSGKKVEVPNIRERLPIELELEVEEALGDVSLDEMIEPGGGAAPAAELQPESRHRGRIASIHRDNVFVDLGGRNQGLLSLRQFPVGGNRVRPAPGRRSRSGRTPRVPGSRAAPPRAPRPGRASGPARRP